MLKLIRQAIDFRNRTNRRIAQGIEDGTVYAIRRSTGGRVRNVIILFGAMNLLLWLVGTIFAATAYSAVYTIFSVWEKPAFIILLIPVVTGMIFAYSLIRAKIPDVEDCELERRRYGQRYLQPKVA